MPVAKGAMEESRPGSKAILKNGEERIGPIVAKAGNRCRRGVGGRLLLILVEEYDLGIHAIHLIHVDACLPRARRGRPPGAAAVLPAWLSALVCSCLLRASMASALACS